MEGGIYVAAVFLIIMTLNLVVLSKLHKAANDLKNVKEEAEDRYNRLTVSVGKLEAEKAVLNYKNGLQEEEIKTYLKVIESVAKDGRIL